MLTKAETEIKKLQNTQAPDVAIDVQSKIPPKITIEKTPIQTKTIHPRADEKIKKIAAENQDKIDAKLKTLLELQGMKGALKHE